MAVVVEDSVEAALDRTVLEAALHSPVGEDSLGVGSALVEVVRMVVVGEDMGSDPVVEDTDYIGAARSLAVDPGRVDIQT
jgi:hypothetical protein